MESPYRSRAVEWPNRRVVGAGTIEVQASHRFVPRPCYRSTNGSRFNTLSLFLRLAGNSAPSRGVIVIERRRIVAEIDIGRIAVVRKDIIRRANAARVPVITATRMLESCVPAGCPRGPRRPTSPTPPSTAPTPSCSPPKPPWASIRSRPFHDGPHRARGGAALGTRRHQPAPGSSSRAETASCSS